MSREMKQVPRGLSRVLPRLAPLVLAFLMAAAHPSIGHAQIDAGIDLTIWKMLYGVTDAQAADPNWLARDDDGDGVTNGAELAAGTNPFSATSTFKVTSVVNSPTATALAFPTVLNKLYVLQASPTIDATATWAPLSPNVQAMGTGSPLTLSAPRPSNGASMFYRVVVQDVDTDGDGVSDWAESATGFYDPTTAHTHGAAIDDHTSLTADLAQENVITVSATKSTATEPPDLVTAASDMGTITISRGGTLHFSTLTVALNWTGTAVSNTDYAPMPTTVTFGPKVGVITLTLTPLANANLRTGVVATAYAMPGNGYSVSANGSASVVIAPAGNTTGTGLTGYYYNSTSALVGTYSPNLFLPANLKLTRLDPGVNFLFNGLSPGTGVNATYWNARWKGQVQPQYSETYYFDTKTDDGVKLWVNGQLIIDGWTYSAPDRIGQITLQAGVLYDIQMDYFQGSGGSSAYLYWYSNSQPKVIIPANRLYPDTIVNAPPAITSAASAIGFVNQPFTFALTASNTSDSATTFALGAKSGALPPGLIINASSGVISGTPTTAGNYPITVIAANAYGTGASVMDIEILAAGSGVTRELWQAAGPNISDIPLASTPGSIDGTLATLEDDTLYADNTGERLRGYFTAPSTGNYYFWLAANNVAELWISDDSEYVNKVRRAWVTSPGTASEAWTTSGQTKQRSPWLALVAGQTYYYEVLHNTGTGATSDNVAIGYLMDPTGLATTPFVSGASANTTNTTNTTKGAGTTSSAVGKTAHGAKAAAVAQTSIKPLANGTASTGVVPAFVLSQYDYPAATTSTGTLYVTNLSPQGASTSHATGSADLRMNSDYSQGILHFNFTGLTSSRTAYHIHLQDSSGSGPIVYDIDDVDRFHPELKTSDGGYIWNIAASGTNTVPMIVAGIKAGNTYFNVHTVNYPGGEIRGNLVAVQGSQIAPTLVPNPSYADDHASDAGAARFLNQASFGAAPTDMASVQSNGYAAWITNQLSLPATHLTPTTQALLALTPSLFLSAPPVDNAWWQASVTAPDQLRQRVAFALSQIMVVSDTNSSISSTPLGLASYYDTLLDNSFGNFRTLMENVTLHPVMGYWLNMQGNQKGNLSTGYHPDENYAREIMQLFSIGLNRLWPDGTLVLNSTGDLVPTYTQNTITNGFARIYTGWTWHQALQASGQLPTSFSPATDWIDPMVMVKNYHELGTKTVLDNVVLPAATGYSLTASAVTGSQADTTTAAYDSYCLQDLETALDNIFYHPNVGPYICRQLIQRLVESNPTPAYLNRVVQVFNDDGTASHVRGNMAAVITAILLDAEARDPGVANASTSSGKQREPLLRITGPGRTFPSSSYTGTYSESNGLPLTVTTSAANHYSAGDVVWLDFSPNDAGTPPVAPVNNPSTGSYTILSTPAPTSTTFAVNASSLTSVTYAQAAGSTTLTVNTSGPSAGGEVYLKFVSGAETDGVYTVTSDPTTSSFAVTTSSAPTAAVSGTVIVPKTGGYDSITNPSGSTVSTMVIATTTNSNVNVGDNVWLQWGAGKQLSDSQWTVASVIDERHFSVTTTVKYNSETSVNLFALYPLGIPNLTRSGSVNIPGSKYDMGNTNSVILQTPMDSPTVFNFFYPNYQYPGTLAVADVTTPEFQLTTDSNIVTLTNTINSTILSSGNTNGLSNFKSGAINLDLSAYMTAPYVTYSTVTTTSGTKVTAVTTTTVNATLLIQKLGDILTGGMLNGASGGTTTQSTIAAFLNNTTYFPPTVTVTGTTTVPPVPPTLPTTSARDRVRAVVQMILESPEYAVQR